MDTNAFRYAGVYWHYGSKNVVFDEVLADAHSQIRSMEDYGEASCEGFYELTPDGWVEIDSDTVKRLDDEREAEERRREKGRAERIELKPYRLWVYGPKDTPDWWASYVTQAEADEAAAKLPPGMAWTVTTDKRVPRLARR